MKHLQRIELGLALLLTALAVVLHLRYATHAGALWRDEVNSVEIAALPSLGEMWNNLQFDSFPIAWLVILKIWCGLGFASDSGLRLLGFLTGIGGLAAIWANARLLKRPVPLIALALLGLSPTVIRWGDSIRAWGLGLLLTIIVLALLWQVIEKPDWKRFAAAFSICVLGVQTSYYFAVILFSIGVPIMVLAVIRKNWRALTLLALISGVSALSLFPYVGMMRRAGDWNMILHRPDFTFGWFLEKLTQAIAPLWGGLDVAIWLGLVATGCSVAFFNATYPEPQRRKCAKKELAKSEPVGPEGSDSSLSGGPLANISLVILGLVFVAYFLFLQTLSYQTNAWYYLSLMGLSAILVDFSIASNIGATTLRVMRIGMASALLLLWFPVAWTQVGQRQTNVDLIAHTIQSSSNSADSIIINPWESAITFQRYYKGNCVWSTLPPVGIPKVHRFDLVKEMMTQSVPADAVKPLLSQAETTLKSGGKLWLIGGVEFLQNGATPAILPPAPNSPYGWMNVAYYSMWSQQLGNLIQKHALRATQVEVPCASPVSAFENLQLIVIEGWREKSL